MSDSRAAPQSTRMTPAPSAASRPSSMTRPAGPSRTGITPEMRPLPEMPSICHSLSRRSIDTSRTRRSSAFVRAALFQPAFSTTSRPPASAAVASWICTSGPADRGRIVKRARGASTGTPAMARLALSVCAPAVASGESPLSVTLPETPSTSTAAVPTARSSKVRVSRVVSAPPESTAKSPLTRTTPAARRMGARRRLRPRG